MISIAIDGPSGAGKSSLSRRLAAELGYIYVDTGAMYRTIGLHVLRSGADTEDEDAVAALLPGIRLEMRYVDGVQHMFLNGEDVSGLIRTEEVSMAASHVSAHPSVRAFLLDAQRALAKDNNVLMDGRDIGTVVLPGAQVTMWFYWIIVPLAWLVWHIAFRIRVIGRENLIHDRGFVIAPNHISAIDPVFVVIARFWGRPMVIMAKEELFEISRLLNWAWRHVGVVCVRRGKGDATVVENTVREVREGRGALVFPEGTRTKEGNLGKLKSGAFVIAAEAGVDMIPCRIIYKGGKMRVFGRCTVVFGKPIPAEKLKLGEPRSAARLRECKALLAEELEKLLEENRQYL